MPVELGTSFLKSGYVFYERLLEDGLYYERPDLVNIYNAVNGKIDFILREDNIKRIRGQSAIRLVDLAKAEEKKEQALIKSRLGLDIKYDLNSPETVRLFLESISAVIRLKERHIQNLKNIIENKENENPIYEVFFEEKQNTLKDRIINTLREQKTKEILEKNLVSENYDQLKFFVMGKIQENLNSAMIESLSKSNEEQYVKMLEALKNDKDYKNSFYGQLGKIFQIEKMVKEFLDSIISEKDLDRGIEQAVNHIVIKKNDIQMRKLIEQIVKVSFINGLKSADFSNETLSMSFNPKAIQGQHNEKTSMYIAIKVPTKIITDSFSHKRMSRLQAINDARKLHEQLSYFDDGFIIRERANFSSLLGSSKFQGYATSFSGNSGLNLLREIYEKAGFSGRNSEAEQVFNAIKNLGKGTVGDGNKELLNVVKNALGADIAYALFDDIDDLGVFNFNGANQIHILDLNGTQVTLSLFLKLLAKAYLKMVQDLERSPSDFVRITISPAPAKYSNLDYYEYTMKMWRDQKTYSENNSIIKAHFLKNFSEIIKEYLSY